MTVTDLFAGAGGSSTGAIQIPGVHVKIAANHWQLVTDIHALNHQDTDHAVVDLHQERPSFFPSTDMLWASPECNSMSLDRDAIRLVVSRCAKRVVSVRSDVNNHGNTVIERDDIKSVRDPARVQSGKVADLSPVLTRDPVRHVVEFEVPGSDALGQVGGVGLFQALTRCFKHVIGHPGTLPAASVIA